MTQPYRLTIDSTNLDASSCSAVLNVKNNLRFVFHEQTQKKKKNVGILTVLENDFQLKTDIPLYEGDNIIGRFVKGTNANAAFKTVDPSIDTTHCIVNVKLLKDGRTTITLRDAPSGTGTFLQGEILNDRERATIENGSIINIGAATIILKLQTDDEA